MRKRVKTNFIYHLIFFLFLGEFVELVDSADSNPVESQGSSYSQELNVAGPSNPKKSRGTINIFNNEKLIATLDKCLITDRNATRIVLAVAEALNFDVRNLTLNKSSINSCRKIIRCKMAERIKEHMSGIPLRATVLHWDGKLVQEMSRVDKVDRLPIIITDGDFEKILSIPALESGSGRAQASAMLDVIYNYFDYYCYYYY